MAWAGVDGLRAQLFRQLKAAAGKGEGSAVQTLLERAAGIERMADGFSVATERGLALQLSVGRKGPQAIHLVAHLAGGGLRRIAEAFVELAHPLHERRELGVEGIAASGRLSILTLK